MVILICFGGAQRRPAEFHIASVNLGDFYSSFSLRVSICTEFSPVKVLSLIFRTYNLIVGYCSEYLQVRHQ